MTKVIPAIFEDGHLTPLKPLNLPEHQKVLLAVTIPDDDDLPGLSIAKLAEESLSFQFLNNPEENIYSPSDGEPVN